MRTRVLVSLQNGLSVPAITVMRQLAKGSKVLRVPALSSAFIDFPNNHVPKTFITSVFTYLIKILKTKHNTKLNANLLKTSLSNNDYFFKQDFLTI